MDEYFYTCFYVTCLLGVGIYFVLKNTIVKEKKTVLITIEGNIGSGKSYLLKNLKKTKDKNYVFIDEPLEYWESLVEGSNTLLQLFYLDKNRWSYTFQNCALFSRYKKIEETIEKNGQSKIFITERCLCTDYEIFAKMLKDDKLINSIEYELYKTLAEFIKDKSTNISAIIYVITNPENSLQRINERGRHGEEEISLEYLKTLDFYHKKWMEKLSKEKFPILYVESHQIDEALNFLNSFL